MVERSESGTAEFDPHAFAEAIETLLLGGPRTLTPLDLAERARWAGRLGHDQVGNHIRMCHTL